AERAELTRGAVYSNFPSKRALYLAVLVDSVERADGTQPGADEQPGSAAELAGAFARGWLERLPLAGDASGDGKLSLRSLTGVLDDEPARLAMTQVVALEALLLGMALERRDPG